MASCNNCQWGLSGRDSESEPSGLGRLAVKRGTVARPGRCTWAPCHATVTVRLHRNHGRHGRAAAAGAAAAAAGVRQV